jgi:hypothetical protein
MSISSHTHPAIPVSIINDSTDSEQVQEVEDDNGDQEEEESDDAELSVSLSYEYDCHGLCTDSTSQKDSVKDGTHRFMASSNPVSRLDTKTNANSTSLPVPQRSVKGLRAYMVFGTSRI